MSNPGYNTLYKPVTRKGPILLTRENKGPPTITTADGRTIQAVPADRAGGAFFNEGFYQWVFPREILGLGSFQMSYGGETIDIADAGQRHEGNGFTDLAPKAGYGSVGGSDGSGVPSGFAPGNFGDLGFFPADLSGLFPSPVLSEYNDISAAPYDFTNVLDFAKEYGDFNREETILNNELAKGFAFDALDTELRGLQGYVPGASALKRRETSLDNAFNQAERDAAIQRTLSFARGDLETQRGRANQFARGEIPDSVADRGLEIGVRSAAADRAATAGFGGTSPASRRDQELMTAKERVALSQYGDRLLTNNIGTQANLFMAPTQYSNAGQQVNVMPSVSGSQLQTQARGELNQNTLISPGQALTTQVQQNQFVTSLEQQTRQFNAQNQLQNSQFNAGTQNEFALTKFGYQVGLAGAIAGAAQTASNTQIEIDQQNRAFELYEESLKLAQNLREMNAIFQGLGSILGGAGGIGGIIGGIGSLIGSLGSLFGGGDDGESVGVPDGTSEGLPPLSDIREDFENPETGPSPSSPDFDAIDEGADDSFVRDDIPENVPQPPASPDEIPDDFEPFSARAASLPPTRAMRAAGISDTPKNGFAPAGFGANGKQVYVNKELAQSSDVTQGQKFTEGLSQVLEPFGVLPSKEYDTLKNIGIIASDLQLIGSLTDAYQRGDKKAFVNTLLNKLQRPAINKLVSSKTDRAGLNAAVDAIQLFQNWDRLSPASRSMAIASIGINAARFNGTELTNVPIIKPGAAGPGTPGLSVGQALGLFQAGYNTYSLVKHWDQLNDIQRVVGGAGTVASIAEVARGFDLLGAGTAGTVASVAGPVTGAASFYFGAQGLRDSWGQGGKKGLVNGALNGSAMAVGLIGMFGGAAAPVAAGVFATSVIGSVVKTGKEENQVMRDNVRKQFKKIGLVDNKFKVTLPDGSVGDLGIDGKGGRRLAKDPAKLVENRKLYAYDIDYTNDLDYLSGMAGIALARLGSGGQGKNIDQIGGQLGNLALGKVGFGKELTRDNFDAVMQNHRGLYAKAGINSKQDAYALTEIMYQEGRINETQAIAMHQAFNMMYDRNGWDIAQKLMTGRWRGIEVAGGKEPPKQNKADKNFAPGIDITKVDPKTDIGFSQPALNPKSGNLNQWAGAMRSKEAVRQRNREKFARAA